MLRRRIAVALLLVTALLAGTAGCGDDDAGTDGAASSGAETPEGDGGGEGSEGDAGQATLEDALACVEAEGFEIRTDVDEITPPELDEQRGVVDRIEFALSEPEPGLGAATWFQTDAHADEALESAELVATEERHLGRIGLVVYSMGGADTSVAALEGCLRP